MADRYWIATDSQSWTDTDYWSTSSGGSGGASVPGSSDKAIFDENGSGDCTKTTWDGACHSLDATDYSGTISATGAIIINGGSSASCIIGTNATLTATGGGQLEITCGTVTIDGVLTIASIEACKISNADFACTVNGSGLIDTIFFLGSVNYKTNSFVFSGTTTLQDCTLEAKLGCTTTISVSGDLKIAGDLTITPTAGDGGSLVWSKSTGSITLTGAGDQNIDFAGFTIEDLEVDKTSGSALLTESFTTDSITLTDGTLDLNGYSIESVGNVTLAAGTTVTDTS